MLKNCTINTQQQRQHKEWKKNIIHNPHKSSGSWNLNDFKHTSLHYAFNTSSVDVWGESQNSFDVIKTTVSPEELKAES